MLDLYHLLIQPCQKRFPLREHACKNDFDLEKVRDLKLTCATACMERRAGASHASAFI